MNKSMEGLEPWDPGVQYCALVNFSKTKFSIFYMSDEEEDEEEGLFQTWSVIQGDLSDYDSE
jgi:hypothetical protein